MGTNQIMLVILSVVLVAVGTALGIFIFQNQSQNTNRQLLVTDLNFLGTEALRFWRTPVSMGGGAPTITTEDQAQLEFYLHWSGNTTTTASGTYSVLANDDGTINVTGIGTEIGNDNENPVRAEMIVDTNSDHLLTITLIN
ncbi:MAG: hypothetical protein P9M05_01015 [Candidatus Stygibacter australis]|nr:hypothetical protein [Candidatus Stygibacter australis]